MTVVGLQPTGLTRGAQQDLDPCSGQAQALGPMGADGTDEAAHKAANLRPAQLAFRLRSKRASTISNHSRTNCPMGASCGA
jgi:hypothetical protein